MAFYLSVIAVLVSLCAPLFAVTDQGCMRGCLSRQVSCSRACENFVFRPPLCNSMCSVWNTRCQNRCGNTRVENPNMQSPHAPAAAGGNERGALGGGPTCGRANTNRIVGGTTAGRCEYPWMVLVYNQVNHRFCGGSIIDSKHILTASHCFFTSNERAAVNDLIVFSGSSAMPLNGARVPPNSLHRRNFVAEIRTHPGFRSSEGNDIAILRLRADLPVNECHQPVCLGNWHQNLQEARGCRTMGWGKTTNNPDAPASSDLRWTTVSISPDSTCRRLYSPSTVTSSILCAGGTGSDSCEGDSGGPLVCRGSDGSFYQYGIVSQGLPGQCGRIAGLYTRVSSHAEWIKANTV